MRVGRRDDCNLNPTPPPAGRVKAKCAVPMRPRYTAEKEGRKRGRCWRAHTQQRSEAIRHGTQSITRCPGSCAIKGNLSQTRIERVPPKSALAHTELTLCDTQARRPSYPGSAERHPGRVVESVHLPCVRHESAFRCLVRLRSALPHLRVGPG